MFVYVLVCCYGMSLDHQLLAWHTYYSVLSCSCKCEDAKERPFHPSSLEIGEGWQQ